MNRTLALILTAAGLGVLALFVAPGPQPALPPAPQAVPRGCAVKSGAAGDTLAIQARLSNSFVLEGTSQVFASIDLQAVDVAGERAPVNLALVIDRSGSMLGAKLDHAKAAAHALIDQLRDTDRLAIVHYGSDVVSLPSLLATSDGKARMNAFVDQLTASGSTDMSDALERAEEDIEPAVAGFKASRIILITDGLPNVGLVSHAQLSDLTASFHERGIAVSCLGVGVDVDPDLLHLMAERGAGFYGYLDDASELADIFTRELGQATRAVAKNVELRLEPGPGVEIVQVFGRPSKADGRAVVVPLHDFSGGLSARILARVRVDAAEVKPGATLKVFDAQLAYRDLLHERDAGGSALASVVVASRAEEVEQHVDNAVFGNGVRAEGAEQISRAATAAREGRQSESISLLDGVRNLFGASANALAGEDFTHLEQVRRDISTGGTSGANAAQSRSLRFFGQSTDTY